MSQLRYHFSTTQNLKPVSWASRQVKVTNPADQ